MGNLVNFKDIIMQQNWKSMAAALVDNNLFGHVSKWKLQKL